MTADANDSSKDIITDLKSETAVDINALQRLHLGDLATLGAGTSVPVLVFRQLPTLESRS